MAEGRRLSCSARVEADVVIDVPASSQVHRQVVRKDADAHVIELDPVVRLHYVQVKQPDMHDPSGDLRRLFEALESEWSLEDLTCDLSVLQTLQPTLRGICGTVAVHAPSRSSPSGPACTSSAYGLAIDVGSTTIAAHLCDWQRRGRRFRGRHESADTLRRGLDEPRLLFDDESGGAALMTAAVREALCGLAGMWHAKRASLTRTFSRRRWSAIRSCTTCCSASIRWSSAARRSRWPPIIRSPCGRTSSISNCIATRESTFCRASPGMSARMRREWSSPSARISPRR